MEIGIELRTSCFETMINYRLSQKLKLLGDSEFSLHLGSAFSSESVFFLSLVHCSRDLQVPSFNNFFFKIGSQGTIHTFKNYFAIVFSVFNNKWYPNRPLII